MLIGMALLKLNILTASRSYGFYVAMVIIGYTVGITTNVLEVQAIVASHFDLIVMQRTHLTYDLGRLAVTAGHVGVVMLICKAGCCGRLTKTLAAVGRMALTNYIMQTLICVTVFSGFGFGLHGRLERYQLYYVVAAIWVAQLVISPIWLRFFQFGPLEWVWRSLTYWRIQPVLQSRSAEPVMPK